MIDWLNLVANALWIFACAMALAAFSYASWQASQGGKCLRDVLGNPGYVVVFSLAGLLFSLGLAATSGTLLQIVLWSLLAIFFMIQLALSVNKMRASKD